MNLNLGGVTSSLVYNDPFSSHDLHSASASLAISHLGILSCAPCHANAYFMLAMPPWKVLRLLYVTLLPSCR